MGAAELVLVEQEAIANVISAQKLRAQLGAARSRALGQAIRLLDLNDAPGHLVDIGKG